MTRSKWLIEPKSPESKLRGVWVCDPPHGDQVPIISQLSLSSGCFGVLLGESTVNSVGRVMPLCEG